MSESAAVVTEPALKKTLGGWQVLLYGLGSMLGAGIYALIGRAAEQLGNAVWLAFLAAMTAALLTGLSYACVGSRHARAGGAAYVTHHALRRPWLSYIVGIAVMMSGLTSMATGSQAIAENLYKAVGFDIPAIFGKDPWLALGPLVVTPVDFFTKAGAIVLVFLIGSVIYRGIRESMWANILCTVVEAAGLLFIIAVGMKFWGSVNYLESAGDTPAGGAGSGITLALVMQGAILTFYSFIGFEDILNVSEEVKNPKRDVPFGLIGAMILATLIYLAVAITAVSVVPWRELAASKAPLMDVAQKAAPWFTGIKGVYAVITIFAIGNTALLNYIMGSRLLYGMSRQGLMPVILGKVHAVRRTPHVAIVVLFVIVTTLILSGGVKQLAEATVLLLLSVFTVVNASLVVLKLRPGEERGSFEVPFIVPALGALVCAALIFTRLQRAITSIDKAERIAPIIALAIIAVGMALYAALKPKNVVAVEV